MIKIVSSCQNLPPALVGRGGGALSELTVRFENNTVSMAKYVFLGEGARELGEGDRGFEDVVDVSAFLCGKMHLSPSWHFPSGKNLHGLGCQ